MYQKVIFKGRKRAKIRRGLFTCSQIRFYTFVSIPPIIYRATSHTQGILWQVLFVDKSGRMPNPCPFCWERRRHTSKWPWPPGHPQQVSLRPVRFICNPSFPHLNLVHLSNPCLLFSFTFRSIYPVPKYCIIDLCTVYTLYVYYFPQPQGKLQRSKESICGLAQW